MDDVLNRMEQLIHEVYEHGKADANFQRNAATDRSRMGGKPQASRRSRKKQSRKQALLHEMSQKTWKSYKRKYPKGKKTYIQIRAQVSRSQAYKKKAKRLG